MRPRTAAILACRIIALFLGIEAAIAIISYLLVVRNLGGSGSFWAFLGTRLVVGVALWIVADKVGDAMARDVDDSSATVPPLLDVQVVAFTIVGVVFVAQAIPALIAIVATSTPEFGGFSPFSVGPGFYSARGGAIAGEITRLVVGVMLMVGARPLSAALSRRDAGGEPPA